MARKQRTVLTSLVAATAAAAAFSGTSLATAPPVGPLPSGPSSTIETRKGELVAFALPHRRGGRVWRIARKVDARVLRQVSEADVGASVVVVFKATASGSATVAFGLTRGETKKAYESRRYTVHVR